jgi:hypothetical protein
MEQVRTDGSFMVNKQDVAIGYETVVNHHHAFWSGKDKDQEYAGHREKKEYGFSKQLLAT